MQWDARSAMRDHWLTEAGHDSPRALYAPPQLWTVGDASQQTDHAVRHAHMTAVELVCAEGGGVDDWYVLVNGVRQASVLAIPEKVGGASSLEFRLRNGAGIALVVGGGPTDTREVLASELYDALMEAVVDDATRADIQEEWKEEQQSTTNAEGDLDAVEWSIEGPFRCETQHGEVAIIERVQVSRTARDRRMMRVGVVQTDAKVELDLVRDDGRVQGVHVCARLSRGARRPERVELVTRQRTRVSYKDDVVEDLEVHEIVPARENAIDDIVVATVVVPHPFAVLPPRQLPVVARSTDTPSGNGSGGEARFDDFVFGQRGSLVGELAQTFERLATTCAAAACHGPQGNVDAVLWRARQILDRAEHVVAHRDLALFDALFKTDSEDSVCIVTEALDEYSRSYDTRPNVTIYHALRVYDKSERSGEVGVREIRLDATEVNARRAAYMYFGVEEEYDDLCAAVRKFRAALQLALNVDPKKWMKGGFAQSRTVLDFLQAPVSEEGGSEIELDPHADRINAPAGVIIFSDDCISIGASFYTPKPLSDNGAIRALFDSLSKTVSKTGRALRALGYHGTYWAVHVLESRRLAKKWQKALLRVPSNENSRPLRAVNKYEEVNVKHADEWLTQLVAMLHPATLENALQIAPPPHPAGAAGAAPPDAAAGAIGAAGHRARPPAVRLLPHVWRPALASIKSATVPAALSDYDAKVEGETKIEVDPRATRLARVWQYVQQGGLVFFELLRLLDDNVNATAALYMAGRELARTAFRGRNGEQGSANAKAYARALRHAKRGEVKRVVDAANAVLDAARRELGEVIKTAPSIKCHGAWCRFRPYELWTEMPVAARGNQREEAPALDRDPLLEMFLVAPPTDVGAAILDAEERHDCGVAEQAWRTWPLVVRDAKVPSGDASVEAIDAAAAVVHIWMLVARARCLDKLRSPALRTDVEITRAVVGDAASALRKILLTDKVPAWEKSYALPAMDDPLWGAHPALRAGHCALLYCTAAAAPPQRGAIVLNASAAFSIARFLDALRGHASALRLEPADVFQSLGWTDADVHESLLRVRACDAALHDRLRDAAFLLYPFVRQPVTRARASFYASRSASATTAAAAASAASSPVADAWARRRIHADDATFVSTAPTRERGRTRVSARAHEALTPRRGANDDFGAEHIHFYCAYGAAPSPGAVESDTRPFAKVSPFVDASFDVVGRANTIVDMASLDSTLARIEIATQVVPTHGRCEWYIVDRVERYDLYERHPLVITRRGADTIRVFTARVGDNGPYGAARAMVFNVDRYLHALDLFYNLDACAREYDELDPNPSVLIIDVQDLAAFSVAFALARRTFTVPSYTLIVRGTPDPMPRLANLTTRALSMDATYLTLRELALLHAHASNV